MEQFLAGDTHQSGPSRPLRFHRLPPPQAFNPADLAARSAADRLPDLYPTRAVPLQWPEWHASLPRGARSCV